MARVICPVAPLTRAPMIWPSGGRVTSQNPLRDVSRSASSAAGTDVLPRHESKRCGLNGQRGSAWAALNAVTESADHGQLGGRFVGSEQAKLSRRFESILTGAADEAKQVAYNRALALAT